ncbi:Allophanate hydrolase [Tetrabaena socialis]|uniref:Allophanate hydrolase n=1 Tax=Tetrabaena socialis TaxID=47790 RepID=A0A2J8A7D3_9CHLO|nr:Allophanate hydrolase [Tetrabaena socialis]|eukprot:PNH08428.1 Allophanate hydrolase [Tetrabaena socialis]
MASLNLVLAGAHMSGLGLNHQVVGLGASLVKACKTASLYKMYSLGPRPALIRQGADGQCGHGFDVEVWAFPIERVGEFLRDGVKPPLCIGDVVLEDGSSEKGFLGESYAVRDAEEVSSFGGWRAYLASKQ